MRLYPDADVNFYVDVPDGWDKHNRYHNSHSWRLPHWESITSEPKYIRYYRDFEGAKKSQIRLKDLYFPKWDSNRKRPGACLPLLYAMGARFIKLEKAFPAEFKCTPLPVNLAQLRIIKKKLRAQARALKKWKKMMKDKAKECKGKKNKKKPKCKRLARAKARAKLHPPSEKI